MMGRTHRIRVYGVPTTQGSKRAFVNPRTKRAVVTEQMGEKLRNWRASVVDAAGLYVQAQDDLFPITESVSVSMTFYLPRPKTHFNAQGEIKERYRGERPAKRPDLEKLVRAVADALSGIVYHDDSLMVALWAVKMYADEIDPPGCSIAVGALG